MIADLFASGHVADLILIIMAIELIALYGFRQLTRRGVPVLDVLPNILAGACLVLALRSAMVHADWMWIALPLIGALIAHIWDLVSRRPTARG